MKELFNVHKFKPKTLELLRQIEEMLDDYEEQGYSLTLRQLYYQLVASDTIPNNDKEYKKLGSLVSNARYAGRIDWECIEDRLRVPKSPYSADNIADALNDILHSFKLVRQKNQTNYVEVWGEKDAISNILYKVTSKYGIPLMINRGYSSTSAIYDAYERFKEKMEDHMDVTILYVGDHDPSGLDMIDDIRNRINHMLDYGDDIPESYVLGDVNFEIHPIALTKEQIDKFQPPPNPTKLTDSRSQAYIAEHGHTCWEVDALSPKDLEEIVETEIRSEIHIRSFENVLVEERKQKKELQEFIKNR